MRGVRARAVMCSRRGAPLCLSPSLGVSAVSRSVAQTSECVGAHGSRGSGGLWCGFLQPRGVVNFLCFTFSKLKLIQDRNP